MIQQETMLDIADNSGVKSAQCIKVLGRSGGKSGKGKATRATASIGDVICVAIKKTLPSCQLDDKKVHRCVIIRTTTPIKRADGSYVRFDSNAAVMVDGDGNPIGTRVFGAVARELREKNYMKIVSLASEVV
ncbi:MAG TPA: 50S ribosomal protein L14 [Sedimentisphaerales bacterium]|nr:50S ribosomal protein L14 [Sedimentisphaerales bacterium]